MRIVSLLPSATEILFALGLDREIVGVSHECDFPPKARTKPVVIRSRIPHGASPAEIDAGEAPCGIRERITTGFVRAFGGKSHSWLTPTISRSSPSANRISVADGSSETMRIDEECITFAKMTKSKNGQQQEKALRRNQP